MASFSIRKDSDEMKVGKYRCKMEIIREDGSGPGPSVQCFNHCSKTSFIDKDGKKLYLCRDCMPVYKIINKLTYEIDKELSFKSF